MSNGALSEWGRLGLSPLSDEVHIWAAFPDDVDTRAATKRFESWLSEDEVARYHRFRRDEDRELFLVARATLRHSLSQYVDVEPGQWRFVTADGERPELAAPFDALGLHFSVSHTPGLVACLVSDSGEVGIDVEGAGRVPDVFKLAAVVCSGAEIDTLKRLPPIAAEARFYELWTLKEAYAKARGTGLAFPLNKLTFAGGGDIPVSADFDSPIEDRPDQWQFALWRPSPEHQGALALRRGIRPDRRYIFRAAWGSQIG